MIDSLFESNLGDEFWIEIQNEKVCKGVEQLSLDIYSQLKCQQACTNIKTCVGINCNDNFQSCSYNCFICHSQGLAPGSDDDIHIEMPGI